MNKTQLLILGRRVNVLSATFLLAIFSLFTSCKKEDTKNGKGTFPVDLLLQSGGVDTFTLKTYTVASDSVFGTNLATFSLGMMNDPEMGSIRAGLYTEFDLAYLNPNFAPGVQITVDSFVMALKFNRGYGQISKQKVEIHELDAKLYKDTNYLVTRDTPVKADNWVTDNWVKFDNVGRKIDGADTLLPQVRIHLDVTKAQSLLNHIQNNPGAFPTNDAFKNYFKGLYITSTAVENNGDGMIGTFDAVTKDTKISIYYKVDGVRDVMTFTISGTTNRYTRYHHNVSGTALDLLLSDSTLGQKRFFAQAGRHYAAVNMPTIKDLPKKAVVHSAYLYLPIEVFPLSSFKQAATVYAIGGTSKKPLANSATGYENVYKGYLIDIKGYVQGTLTGVVKEETLFILPDAFNTSGNRLIFNGPTTSNKFRPRLIINYTEF